MKHIRKSERKLEHSLFEYGAANSLKPDEFQIRRTVERAARALSAAGDSGMLSYMEFFWIQVRMIRKRWWILQAFLLFGVWKLLSLSDASPHIQRGLGIAAALFIVLMMPELWKNRCSNSMEIEEAAYYSLKQVYSVRLIAFGLIDVFMLTIFCLITVNTQDVSMYSLLKQFVFPMVMSTAICFGIFCGRKHYDEVPAMFACITVNSIWTLAVMNGKLYAVMTPPLWAGLFTIASIFIIFSVWRMLSGQSRSWEGILNGIEPE